MSQISDKAQSASTVVVPMAVHALVISENITAQPSAQFAPLIEPDYGTLLQTPSAGAHNHDLLDDIDLSYWRTQARFNPRFVNLGSGGLKPNRTGIYLSWCLPKLYRAAITATDTALEDKQEWNSRKMRAGFKLTENDKNLNKDDETTNSKQDDIHFRPAPDRWVIVRRVRDWPAKTRQFIVESNCIRRLDDPELAQAGNIEAQTCPAMDPTKPAEEQPMLRLGRAVPLTQDNLEVPPSATRRYREPFNAFELGHEFFPDYTPHNMGVFSFFDNLEGMDWKDSIYNVDYLIIGFHFNAETCDPFTFVDRDRLLPLDRQDEGVGTMNNEDLMKVLNLTANKEAPAATKFAKASATGIGRTLTHGVIRNILWNRQLMVPGVRWPAASLQDRVHAEQPITIGTHIMDALTAYLHIAMDGSSLSELGAHDTLGQLLIRVSAQSSEVDSLARAAEDAASHSFLANPEGIAWKLPKNATEDAPKVRDEPLTTAATDQKKRPAEERRADADEQLMQRQLLTTLNEGQMALDTCARESQQLLQRLFGCWWNANSIRRLAWGQKRDTLTASNKAEAQQIESRLIEIFIYCGDDTKGITKTVNGLRKQLETSLGVGQSLENTPASSFGKHQDPTVLVAGTSSGWPKDFGQKTTPVRIADEIVTDENDTTETFLDQLLPKISDPANRLLREFDGFTPGSTPNPYAALEDSKDTQGWFPLFLEWKVEYYHVPFSKWEFTPDSVTGRWRYVIPAEKSDCRLPTDSAVGQDMRVIGGRISFLPQPGVSLRTRLEQLFAQATSEGSQHDEERRRVLMERAGNLEYFASPLAGLADHLLTLCRGHYPRPSPNDSELEAALGITPATMLLLANSDPSVRELAPYGLSTPLPPSYTNSFSPFKPVTHGQVRFVKFGIVDKFGQVVSGLRLTPHGEGAMYPNISPALACGLLPVDKSKGQAEEEYWPNTAVQAEDGPGLCQFFQIPPRINQRARLNASFLAPLSDAEVQSFAATEPNNKTEIVRRTAGEWDNPIWAWLLPNFQNHAIQVYLPMGEFMIEVLLDHDNKKTITSRGPMDTAGHTPEASGRLPQLVEAMNNYDFSNNLFNMLAGASDSITSSSSADFDGSLPAALGKPFCVADVGVSIELSAPPPKDASLHSTKPTEQELLNYEFSVTVGNPVAAFDGLVGTFPSAGEITHVASAFDRDAEELGPNSAGVATIIKKNRDEHPSPLGGVRPYFLPGTTENLDLEHRKKLKTVSVIMDPKTPVRVYTGSLFPVADLALPRFPTDAALRSMRAFFAVGPMLVPCKPVMGLVRPSVEDPDAKNSAPAVQMPLGGGEGASAWTWLQPWLGDDKAKTEWGSAAIRPLDTVLKVEAAAESELVDGYVLVK